MSFAKRAGSGGEVVTAAPLVTYWTGWIWKPQLPCLGLSSFIWTLKGLQKKPRALPVRTEGQRKGCLVMGKWGHDTFPKSIGLQCSSSLSDHQQGVKRQPDPASQSISASNPRTAIALERLFPRWLCDLWLTECQPLWEQDGN